MDVHAAVRHYIEENFLARRGGDQLQDDDQLLDSGIVDSMGIFQLVSFLESEFGIDVADEEMVPDNFETVTTIASFVAAKHGNGDA